MANELHILHLEDDRRDTELMVASLRHAGIECEVVRVDAREQFVDAQSELRRLNMELESRPQIVGRTDHEVMPARVADTYRAHDMQVMESGQPLDFEEVGPEEDLQPRVFHSSRFRLRDNTGTSYALCGSSTDITERKRAEQSMSIARREAERANRAKSEFLSRIEAGRHLLDLMNEVLDISRIESGNLSLSPEAVAVAEIVDRVAKLIRPLGAPKQIEVVVAPSAARERYVRADRQRLNQILRRAESDRRESVSHEAARRVEDARAH